MIEVKKFIDQEWDGASPLLLGYSGGPDSKALLYALLETAAAKSIHLAHVDHGWREESSEEARLLAEEAAALKLPFYSIRLSEMPARNLEDAARLERFRFFRSLFDQIPFQALLLAHHADDVAETALKRLLEGAHLPNLGGMAKVGIIEGMKVWRPFLSARKRAILEQRLGGFDDATNRDSKFLRSRLRQEILPTLARSFGKEVALNLTLLSERAFELREYLDRKTAAIEVLKGPWGMAVELKGLERIEARHLLLKWAPVSRSLLEAVLDAKQGRFGPFFAFRGWVFCLSERFPRFGEDLLLRSGIFHSGDWEVGIMQGDEKRTISWKDLWKGDFTVSLPEGSLKKPEYIPNVTQNKSSEAYRTARIPPFLRPLIPVLDGKNIFGRFPQPHWQVRFFTPLTPSFSKRFDRIEEPS